LAQLFAVYLMLPPSDTTTSERGILWWFSQANVIILLLLAQSKTVFFVCLLAPIVGILYRIQEAMSLPLRVLAFFLGTLLAVTTYLNLDLLRSVVFSSTDYSAAKAETLSGRTFIWEAVIEEWQLKPMIGHGSMSWVEAASNFRLPNSFVPGHAHNQLFQTLWSDGLIGTAILAVHVILLMSATRVVRPEIRPRFVGIIASFVIFGTSEIIVPTSVAEFSAPIYITSLLLMSSASNMYEKNDVTLENADLR
jgi:O-antigen ligase